MKGEINKIIRNISAKKDGKTEFGKVSRQFFNVYLETNQGYLSYGFKRTKGKACYL